MNRRKLLLETLERRCLLAADLRITEFMASNDQTWLDEEGASSDWIELYNAGTGDVDLEGWYLTDDAEELDKWAFPSQVFQGGNFLLVAASDKDRAEAGAPLHTNFKLTSNGEYLALVQDTGGELTVVDEYSPEYPVQLTDISYGQGQQVMRQDLVTPESAAKVHVGVPPVGWRTADFDDGDWSSGTAAVGYQITSAGFSVEVATSSKPIQNLTEAQAVLAGENQIARFHRVDPYLNYRDEDQGDGGHYEEDMPFPGDTPGDDNDFALRATGILTIPEEGRYTFGFNSDDGARLRVGHTIVIDDDALHGPEDNLATIDLTPGKHALEILYFERGGGAQFEFFGRRGFRSRFSSTMDLFGDVEEGGLMVETSAGGEEVSLFNDIATDLREAMVDQTTQAQLRIPFDVERPEDLRDLFLEVQYDDGFIAYLNGDEVARRNVGVGSQQAEGNRALRDVVRVESISLAHHADKLRAGTNLLAIAGFNDQANSRDFLLRAGLANIQADFTDPVYFREPTPGTFNQPTGVEAFLVNDVSFDQPHGFYEEPMEVNIRSRTAGTHIRYTTDGSEPTEQNGRDFNGPLTISATTTLRARSFKAGAEPSDVATVTYLFLEDVVRQSPTGQPPEGFPRSRNINGQVLDYGMDPDIVNHRTWGPRLEASLKQVPSISVVMDVDDFVGTRNGIYTHARSHGKAWERPASIEMIHPDGSEGFQVNAGIRIRGGFSRSGGNPKHAFRLFFRDEYGDAKLRYPLFGDEGASQFDKVDLRTTQNYSWSFQGSGRNAFVRDIFSRDVQGQMGHAYTRGRYHHLYINGNYWGLFQTEERPEARFAATYFGGSSDDYDVVKSAGSSGGYQNEATDGTLSAYRRLSEYFYQGGGLSDANMEDYYRAQGMNPDGTRNPFYERLLDVDNLIDYMIITYYTSDTDGPGSKFTRPRVNNYFGIYNRRNPDGFKFFEHDSEHSLDTGNAAGANYNMVTPLTTGGRSFQYFNPHWMHEQLARGNSEYRQRFADAVYRHLHHDGVLTEENAISIIDSRSAEFDEAMIAESARWGDAKRNPPYTQANWRSAVNAAKNWIRNRPEEFFRQLRGQDWYPAHDPPQFTVDGALQHGGETEGTVGLVAQAAMTFETVVPRRSRDWKYLDDGSNQGTAWRAPDFDDAFWESGRAPLGYGGNGERTRISFGSQSGNKHVTAYFRKAFELEDLDGVTGGQIKIRRDDGAVVYLNGQEIARSNMPAGTIQYQTLAASVVGGTAESTFYEYTFDASHLREGVNVLAVEVHQANRSSSDTGMDLELDLGFADPNQAGIYYTTDGSDPRSPGGGVNPAAVRYGDEAIPLAGTTRVLTRWFSGNEWSVLNQAEFTAPRPAGDLTGDGQVDADDIDALTAALRDGVGEPAFDLNQDGEVDVADKTYLVETVLKTRAGDVNLDGTIGFDDFLFLAAKFGKQAAGWADGNFNEDAEVGFPDFLLLAENFGANPAPAAAPVAVHLDALRALAVDALLSDGDDEDGEALGVSLDNGALPVA